MKDSYMDDNEEMPEPMLELEEYGVSFGVLTNNHFVAPGTESAFVKHLPNLHQRNHHPLT